MKSKYRNYFILQSTLSAFSEKILQSLDPLDLALLYKILDPPLLPKRSLCVSGVVLATQMRDTENRSYTAT